MAAHHSPNYLPASPPARLNAYCSATGTTLRELVCVDPSFVKRKGKKLKQASPLNAATSASHPSHRHAR